MTRCQRLGTQQAGLVNIPNLDFFELGEASHFPVATGSGRTPIKETLMDAEELKGDPSSQEETSRPGLRAQSLLNEGEWKAGQGTALNKRGRLQKNRYEGPIIGQGIRQVGYIYVNA